MSAASTPMKNKPKAVFLDIGHTLVQGAQPSARRLLAARLHLSEQETKRAGRLMMVHPATHPAALAKALQEVLPNHARAEIRSCVESLWEEQAGGVTEIPGATQVLGSIKSRGLKLGVISNIWHPFYQGFRRSCAELSKLMDYRILSYQAGCKKPSPLLFRRALAETGLPAACCCMVGDSYELDMAPALQVGMRTVWLLKRPEQEKSAIAAMLRGDSRRPHWVVENLAEILPLLAEMEVRKWLSP